MYYEVYIDILFLNNACLNYIVLAAVKKLGKSAVRHRRLMAFGLLGSLVSCLSFLLLPIPYIVRLIVVYGVVNTGMLAAAFRAKGREIWRYLWMFYTFSFLVGGFVEWISDAPFFMGRGVPSTTGLLVLCVFCGVFLQLAARLYGAWQDRAACMLPVEIEMGEASVSVVGLLDTGNSLTEPISGRPVSILEKEAAGELLGAVSAKDVRYIPYHSLGQAHGRLWGVQAEKITVMRGNDRVVIEQPMIGIYEGKISGKGGYQMILHPGLPGL